MDNLVFQIQQDSEYAFKQLYQTLIPQHYNLTLFISS